MEDDEIQSRVDNAVLDDEDTSVVADNDKGVEDTDSLENDDTSDLAEDDDDQGSNTQTRQTDGGASQEAADGDDAATQTQEDDDDDDGLDYARPELKGEVKVEPFDIRKYRDPQTGLLDAEAANKAIAEHHEKVLEAQRTNSENYETAKQLLTTQWSKASTKFPHIYKNPGLRDLARDLHMNSINTDQYLTPLQAMKKVDKLYRKSFNSAAQQSKTRKRVESAIRTETSGGKSGDTKLSPYEKAKKMAMSSDPNIAKEGRMKVLRIRREARRNAK